MKQYLAGFLSAAVILLVIVCWAQQRQLRVWQDSIDELGLDCDIVRGRLVCAPNAGWNSVAPGTSPFHPEPPATVQQ